MDLTDDVQDPSALTQRLTLRADAVGPTGLDVLGHQLDWRTTTAYTRFLGDTGEQLGFDDYFELGIGLESELDGSLGPLSELSLSGSLLLGDDLFGWSIGLGLAF